MVGFYPKEAQVDPHKRPICVITFRKVSDSLTWSGRQLMSLLESLSIEAREIVFWYDDEAWQVSIDLRGVSVLLAADVDGTPFRANGFNSFILMDYEFPGSRDAVVRPNRLEIIRRVKGLAVLLYENMEGAELSTPLSGRTE